jgi:hypothetical protein
VLATGAATAAADRCAIDRASRDAIGKVLQQLPTNNDVAAYPLLGRTRFVSLSCRIE